MKSAINIIAFILCISVIISCKKDYCPNCAAHILNIPVPANQVPYTSIDDFLSALAPSAKIFSIEPLSDTFLYGRQGTKLYFDDSSFVDSKGDIVTTQVIVEFTEIYSKRDMILNQRPTITNGWVLESEGEFLVEASTNGTPVWMAPNKKYTITRSIWYIPKPGMKYYEGYDSSGIFLWSLADSNLFVTNIDPCGHSSYYKIFGKTFSWGNIDGRVVSQGLGNTYVNIKPITNNLKIDELAGFLVLDSTVSVCPFVENYNLNVLTSQPFYVVPKGTKATIIILGINKKLLYAGKKTVVVTNDSAINVTVSPIAEKDFMVLLNSL